MRPPRTGRQPRPGPAPRWRNGRTLATPGRTLLIIAALFAAVVAFVLIVLGPLSWWLATDNVRHLRGKEQADAFNAVRQTVLVALAGTAALSGAAFTARSYVLARRGQVTERFHKATAQLGAATPEERLGGIYALEQIWKESPRDHSAILELLCSYVRIRSTIQPLANDSESLFPPWESPSQAVYPSEPVHLPADVQAVMTVIARRPDRPEPHRPILVGASLPRVSIRMHEFQRSPRLSSVFFTGADLRNADLRGADLTTAIMSYADLRGAMLAEACLNGAHLYRADLRSTSLTGADLTGTDVRGAHLGEIEGLEARQLSTALIDNETILPRSLRDNPWVIARIADCNDTHARHEGHFCPPPTPAPQRDKL